MTLRRLSLAVLVALVAGMACGVFIAYSGILVDRDGMREPMLRYYALEPLMKSLNAAGIIEWSPSPPTHKGRMNNIEGFRDVESFSHKLAMLNDRRVIVLMGSSGGWGFGLRFEDTFGPVLERELARRGVRAAVFNLSQIAMTTSIARSVFEQWQPRIKPDLVIVNLGHVDSLMDELLLADQNIFKGDVDRPRLARRLLLRLYARRLAAYFVPRRAPFKDRFVPLSTFLWNLEETGRLAGGRESGVLLIPARTAPPMRPALRIYDEAMAQTFAGPGAVRYLGRMERGIFDDARNYQQDRKHPSADGIRAMVRAMLPEVLESLSRCGPAPRPPA